MSATLAGAVGDVVEVRKTLRAPREKVFEAWTRPEELKRWHSSGPTVITAASVDLRVGGAWSMTMRNSQGQDNTVGGVYRDIVRPQRLVYTWGWSNPNMVQSSTVTVDFNVVDGGTEVVVRHEGLGGEESRTAHLKGWEGGLEKLSGIFAG